MDNKAKKEIAKIYYVNHNYTLKQISEDLSISAQTLTKWNQQGSWDMLKAANASRDDEIIRRSYEQINRILKVAEDDDRCINDGEADKIAKISKSIQNLKTKATLGQVIEFSEELLLFIREVNQDMAIKIADIFKQFVNKKAQHYNGSR